VNVVICSTLSNVILLAVLALTYDGNETLLTCIDAGKKLIIRVIDDDNLFCNDP
jgi:hypothetical protein